MSMYLPDVGSHLFFSSRLLSSLALGLFLFLFLLLCLYLYLCLCLFLFLCCLFLGLLDRLFNYFYDYRIVTDAECYVFWREAIASTEQANDIKLQALE